MAQQAEDHAQLVLGRPAGGLDGLESRARLLGVLVHEASADARLHGYDRQGVGDDVVQLAGDTDPLILDGAPRAIGVRRPLVFGG